MAAPGSATLPIRPQDNQDIAGVIAVHRDAIDWTYCESVAAQLEQVMEMDLVKIVSQLQES